MRMHSHGKCSANIILAALSIFSLIVLYNYWTLSVVNRDLVAEVHRLEDRIISASKTNDALQANLEKMQEIKDKVEENLKKEQKLEVRTKEELSNKDAKLSSLQVDLEKAQKAGDNCRDEFTSSQSKVKSYEKEISELKSKIVSLEAQVVEKGNKITALEMSSSSPKSVDSQRQFGEGPAEPVLLSDPAVPYPAGWMKVGGSVKRVKGVSIKSEGDEGIKRTKSMGPVIIFDNPNKPRAKARFSVLDPKKNEMKPGPESLVSPLKQAKSNPAHDEPNGGEDFDPVLTAPGAGQGQGHAEGQGQAENLDAAEDDGDRPLKEELDDQSPDGNLGRPHPKQSQ